MKRSTVKKTDKNTVRIREEAPRARIGKAGYELLCPFCEPTHPLFPGTPAACGSELKITVLQPVYPPYVVKARKMKCVKCGKSDGEMVPYMSGFVHLPDCDPATKLLTMPPKFSRAARMVHALPKFAQKMIEKRAGFVQEVKEIDGLGHETGKTLGYFFLPKGKPHAKRTATDPGQPVPG